MQQICRSPPGVKLKSVKSAGPLSPLLFRVSDPSLDICTRLVLGTSSLGRYVFGSEISYNKPPPPAWASLLNKPKSQKIVGH